MKRNWIVLVTLVLGLFLATPVWAMSLDEAKSQGLVGETPSGYLEAVSSPSPEVQKLIQSINAKRREKYQEIAKKNGTNVSAVEALAGKKAIDETGSGGYVKTPGGAWQKK